MGDPWTEGGWHSPPILQNGVIYSITKKQYKDAQLEHAGGEWKNTYLDAKSIGGRLCWYFRDDYYSWSCCFNPRFFGKCKNKNQ